MLRHVVCLTFRPGTDPAAVDALERALAALPAVIAEVRAYAFGRDLALADANADFAIVADFDDEAGWRAYQEHPEHQRVLREHVVPIVDHRAAVQLAITD